MDTERGTLDDDIRREAVLESRKHGPDYKHGLDYSPILRGAGNDGAGDVDGKIGHAQWEEKEREMEERSRRIAEREAHVHEREVMVKEREHEVLARQVM